MSISLRREMLRWATIPNPCTYSGLIPGSRNKFTLSALEQHNDPVVGFYTEVTYLYASPQGVIRIDFTPFLQRAFAKLYNNNDPIKDALVSKWRYNQVELSIETELYDADPPEGYPNPQEGTDEGNLLIYGGVPLNEKYKSAQFFLISWGYRFLTSNTTIELNRYLPSNLCAWMDPSYAPIRWDLKKNGVLVASLNLTYDSTFNTSYIAKTYGDGEYTLERYRPSVVAPVKYKLIVKNCEAVKDEITNGRAVYLRWLNSLGGFSYGLFKVKTESRTIATDVLSREYSRTTPGSDNPAGGMYEGDFTTLSKITGRSLQIGKGQVGWDQMPDLLDLMSSIDVVAWDPGNQTPFQANFGSWTPVLVSGGASPRRDYNYNEFSCTITFPELFTQKR